MERENNINKIKKETVCRCCSQGKRLNIVYSWPLILPLFALGSALALHLLLPNTNPANYESYYYPFILELLLGLYGVCLVFSFFWRRLQKSLLYHAPFWSVLVLLIAFYDLATLKFGWLPLPFFPGPDKILDSGIGDWQLLGISTLYSLRLLLLGFVLGSVTGLFTGVFLGWSKHWSYWLSPVMKFLGPIPATAWIPIAMVAFASSFAASTFLIALCVWFPVTVMTSSGVQNVNKSWLEGAQILGASENYQIFRVAVPAAMPHIFTGLFMGLATSFITLIAAEMLGVKAGLGWYIQWANGWAEYSKIYCSIIIMAVLFSGLIRLLFLFRDKLLRWQKGLLKW